MSESTLIGADLQDRPAHISAATAPAALRLASWSPDLLIIAMAALAHWPLLRLRGTYWDDWMLLRAPGLTQFRLTGRVEFAYLHRLLLRADDPVHLARSLQFGLWVVAAVVLHRCLRRLPTLPARVALTASCVFAALPTYHARVAQIMLPSTFALVVFLLFWLLLLRTAPPDLSAARGVALVGTLVVALSLQSLLVFVAVPFAVWVASHAGVRTTWRSSRSRSALVALGATPVVYYVLRSVLLPPSGVFEGYNSVSVPATVVGLIRFLLGAPEILYEVLVRGFAVSAAGVAAVAVLAYVALAPQQRASTPEVVADQPLTGRVAQLGLACTGLGALPYILVGKPPVQSDWHSRNQILLSIGLAILIAYGVHRVLGARTRAVRAATAVTLATMTISGWATYGEYGIDSARQAALQDAFRNEQALRSSRLLVLDLDHELVDAAGRELRYYETSHLVRDALNVARDDVLVLFSDSANAPWSYEPQLSQRTPFPTNFMGLERVDVSRPSTCSSVTVATEPRPDIAPRRLPSLLFDGIAERPTFAVTDIEHGCATNAVQQVLARG